MRVVIVVSMMSLRCRVYSSSRINKPIWDEIHGVLEMVAENASKKIDSESSRRRFDDVASMSRL